MTTNTSLHRNCSACGLEKPLSAFLYLTSEGTMYGTICATCRGKGIKEKAQKHVQEEEHSSTTAQMRIGMKELVEIEIQKKIERETLEANEKEAVKKREQLTLEKKESLEEKEKAEKVHRESYIQEKKKQSFLNYQTNKNSFSAQTVLNQKNEVQAKQTPILDEKKRAVEANIKSEEIKQEALKTSIDLSGAPIIDPQNAMVSRHNPMFNQFLTRLGADAPIMKTAQLYHTPVAGQKSPAAPAQPAETPNNDAPREFIEKTWGPSSRKR